MDNVLHKMKANFGDKLVETNGSTCEFNFGDICAGHGTRTDNKKDIYGMPISEARLMFKNGFEDYGISLDAFIEQEKLNGR